MTNNETIARREACQIVLDQLDDLLEGHAEDPSDKGSLLAKRVAQIKKDVERLSRREA